MTIVLRRTYFQSSEPYFIPHPHRVPLLLSPSNHVDLNNLWRQSVAAPNSNNSTLWLFRHSTLAKCNYPASKKRDTLTLDRISPLTQT